MKKIDILALKSILFWFEIATIQDLELECKRKSSFNKPTVYKTGKITFIRGQGRWIQRAARPVVIDPPTPIFVEV